MKDLDDAAPVVQGESLGEEVRCELLEAKERELSDKHTKQERRSGLCTNSIHHRQESFIPAFTHSTNTYLASALHQGLD